MILVWFFVFLALRLGVTSLETRIINKIKFNSYFRFASSNVDVERDTSLIQNAPYDDIIPFLSEHIQLSDQILFLGVSTDLSIQLVKNGYGTRKTGFMTVIDSDAKKISQIEAIAKSETQLNELMEMGKLKFKTIDFTNMPEICKQSTYDSIVDCGGLDSVLHSNAGKDGMLKTIDQLQNALRLGNILVCLSQIDKDEFCSPFEERFGWMQELDGDPGEISAWYRGKTNIAATKSNFSKLGLKMYVYTNTDNC
jgi:hypothetical protein